MLNWKRIHHELKQSGILGVFENIMLKISAYQNKNHTGILPVWFSGVRSKECFSVGGSPSWTHSELQTGFVYKENWSRVGF